MDEGVSKEYVDGGYSSWQQFTEDTSMHGIRYVRMKNSSLIRRLLWALVILIGVGYFSYAAYAFFKGFTEKLITTKIRVENAENLTLPTLTICNRNYWMKSKMVPDSLTAEEKALIDDMMYQLYLTDDLPPPDGRFNWSHPVLIGLSRDNGASSEQIEQFMHSIAHPLNETFEHCSVKKKSVPCHEIVQQVKTDSGYCYRFNGDGTFQTHTAGLSGGVSFTLNTMVDEYYIGPYSFSEGFSIAIHDSTQVPLLSELSYGAHPGLEVHFNLQKKEIKKVPPYADAGRSDCFDTEKLGNPLHYYNVYSYSACKSECRASYVINRCGCRDVFEPAVNGTKTCNVQDMLECSMPASWEFSSNGDHLKECGCKATCNEVQYTARISSYKYPSRLLGDISGCNETCLQKRRDNYLFLHFVYGEMSYEYLEEHIAYSGHDLVSNLGGTLGVCIGASFLTLIEFIEFGFIKLFLLINRSTKRSNTNAVTSMDAKVTAYQ